MTKEELIAQLKELARQGRLNEQAYVYAHDNADELLLAYINDEDIKKAYLEILRSFA